MRRWLLMGASIIWGCASGDGLLLVDLRTDLVPGVDFDRVEVVAGVVSTGRSLTPDAATEDWTRGVRVGELPLVEGRHEVEVRLASRGDSVLSRLLSVEIEGRTGVTLLLSRECRDVICGADETCLAGQCVDPACVSGTESICGFVPECRADADCGGPTGCGPQSCEPPGYCFAERLPCGEGEYCDVDLGCVPEVSWEPLSSRAWVRAVSGPDLLGISVAASAGGFVAAFRTSYEEPGPIEIFDASGTVWSSDAEEPLSIVLFSDPDTAGGLEARAVHRQPERGRRGTPGFDRVALACVGDTCAYGVDENRGEDSDGDPDGDVWIGSLREGEASPAAVASSNAEERIDVYDAALLANGDAVVAFQLTEDEEYFIEASDARTLLSIDFLPGPLDEELHLASDGSSIAAAFAFRRAFDVDGVSIGAEDPGIALYFEVSASFALYTADGSSFDLHDFIHTTRADRPLGLLLAAEDVELATPSGSSLERIEVSSRTLVVVEIGPDGSALGILPLPLPSSDELVGASLHFVAGSDPHYRVLVHSRAGSLDRLHIVRLDETGGFHLQGLVEAAEIHEYDVRDGLDVYVSGSGEPWLNGQRRALPPGGTRFIARHSIEVSTE